MRIHTMSNFILLLASCFMMFPASIRAHLPTGSPFYITGRVYCDTCRFGFETSITTYVAGARVRMECRDSETLGLRYSLETETDADGMYEFTVEDDHEDQICSCSLLESPLPHCNEADQGRSRASAVVTRHMNGVVNSHHRVNNMGFFINKPYDQCQQLRATYFPDDDH